MNDTNGASVAGGGEEAGVLAEGQRRDAGGVRAAAEGLALRHQRQHVHPYHRPLLRGRGQQLPVLADGHGGDAALVGRHAAHGLQRQGVKEVHVAGGLAGRVGQVTLLVACRERTQPLAVRERVDRVQDLHCADVIDVDLRLHHNRHPSTQQVNSKREKKKKKE